ncbi:MAG: terminase family protein [Spirochaetes bacterium]|nr:terminase family protein [Spirochaetota bacterium]
MASRKPTIPLTEYQRTWVEDASRFKIGVITRQGGKSFGTSLEAVLDCVENVTMWVFLSAGERQSKELMGKAAMHARAIGTAVKELESEFWVDKDTKYKLLEITFPNGSRIVGLPANPDTARGWSANILLDEFALHKNSREIWKALFPTVTRGYKIRIISTFKGKTNKFYELFFGAPTLQEFNGREHSFKGERGGWSKHFINIYQAVDMGLELHDEEGKPCEPEDLRLALNDDDAWQEEFECVPSDEVSSFLTHDLISGVDDTKLDADPSWAGNLLKAAWDNYREYKRTKVMPGLPHDILKNVVFLGDLYAGMDIGRHRDLSVIWLDQEVDNILVTAAVIELARAPYFVQEQVLHTILSRPEFKRACIDRTGIGDQLAENAALKYGSSRVEGIYFTPENKEVLAEGLKRNFDDLASRIPASNIIRNSLHSVKKYATATKHFRFDAERTEATGHADHFWAKSLSTQAASRKGKAFCVGHDPEKQQTIMDQGARFQGRAGGFFGRFSGGRISMRGN